MSEFSASAAQQDAAVRSKDCRSKQTGSEQRLEYHPACRGWQPSIQLAIVEGQMHHPENYHANLKSHSNHQGEHIHEVDLSPLISQDFKFMGV